MAKKLKEPLLILPEIKDKKLDNTTIEARMYIDSTGKSWPWVCDQNPRMWLGWEDDAEDEA